VCRNRRLRRRQLLCLPSLLLVPPPLAAAPPEPTALPVLEQVVVTARRRQESAQLTPISLVSLDTAALATHRIAGIAEIGAQVPNFVVDRFPASNQTLRLFIRGVGVGDVQITQDPAVGVYLDGVYLARSTGLSAEVADLKRIEVLRGPQGTLYGRNTTGGALNLVTARPDAGASSLRLEAGSGNRDALRLRAVYNRPLGADAAVKLAAIHDRVDGFIDNAGPGGDFGDRRANGFRLDWRWRPGAALAVDYGWDRSDLESYNYTPQAVDRPLLTGDPADAARISSQRFVRYGEDRFSRLSTSQPLLRTDTLVTGHALNLEWRRERLTLKSITAWRELEDHSFVDFASGASAEYRVDFNAIELGAGSAGPLPFGTVPTRLDQDQFSQELQVFGRLGQRLDYVAGLYYFREEGRENWFPVHHIFSFPLIETGDRALAVNVRAEDNRIENQAVAFYTQWTWSPGWLEERLRLSAGWRHSRDRRAVERVLLQDNYVDFGGLVAGPFDPIDFRADAERDFDDDSFSLLGEYDWREDLRVYAKFIEAYKSGGFNTRDPDPGFFERGFGAEKNRTLEAGFKGELLSSRLRLNAALFHSEIDDVQLNILLPGSISDTRVFNSGSATVRGFELELLSTPWNGLYLGLIYAWLDSDIDDIVDPFTGEARSFEFPNAPGHSGTLNVDYRLPLAGPASLTVNLNANYVGERTDANPALVRDQYSLLNGRIGVDRLALAGGSVYLGAWIKNALDDDYVAFAIDNLPHASRAVLWGEPRTWGVELRYER
jgi:iron complex outermembrane receptor protein